MVVEPSSQAVPDNSVEHRSAASQRPFRAPAGSSEIILVRHGASADAVHGRPFPKVLGRGNPELSPAGEVQSEAVARRLASEPIGALFVTPLRRTQRSAVPLVAALALEPTVIDDLIEVSLGDWEGGEYRLRAAAGDPIVVRAHAEERWDLIPGGETRESLARRVRAGIERIVELTGPDRAAAAYLHGAVIGEACRQATGSRPFAFVHSDNGSISRLIVGPDGSWLLRSFNDISHLPGAGG
jgi:probable phosphoglycerate mutase